MDPPFTIVVFLWYHKEYERGDPVTKLSSHIAHIISSFYHTLLKLHAIPEFCLSRKRNKKTGKVYLYKQESTSKGRKQTKIKAADEAHYLELYSERQKLKTRLRELKAKYKKLSFHDRRDVRYALACFQHAEEVGIGKIIEKNMFLDGTTRDSKSELIFSLLLICWAYNIRTIIPCTHRDVLIG